MNRKNITKLLLLFIWAGFLLCSCRDKSSKIKSFNTIENVNPDTVGVLKGIFDIPELTVMTSPCSEKHYMFSDNNLVDYDVSPTGASVAAIIEEKSKIDYLKFWQIDLNIISDSCVLPFGLMAQSIVWHPNANALFVMGEKDGNNQIFRIQKDNKEWIVKCIFSTPNQLKRLIVCPRPFITGFEEKTHSDYFAYRLFFGMSNGDDTYRIVSITENGNRFYQVVGPAKMFTKDENEDAEPSKIEAMYALPVAFHPAGHALIWEDKNNKYNIANYDSKYWGKSNQMNITVQKNEAFVPTPNGLGFIHWQKTNKGINIYLLATHKEELQLPNYNFIIKPLCMPDGKGIVGVTLINNKYTLSYVPIKMPLPDVVNAWMFADTTDEIDLFTNYYGLFRPNHGDQLYKLYETENYYCGNYDRNLPTRPYLVTTDIFWEIFGAAYQGLFIVKERDEAIPNFWNFINEADNYLKKTHKKSSWSNVFSTLKDFNNDNISNPEVNNIKNEKDCKSIITNNNYEFSDLKPRGHYMSSLEMEKYFKAFRYFTTIYKKNDEILKELNTFPKDIILFAEKWIESYTGFIAQSRANLALGDLKQTIPDYCQYPQKELTIFPLSWGFDNEVLYSTVYHENIPVNLKVTGVQGDRLLPSSIDLAAVMGNNLAEKLLESDYIKYPPLRKVIELLKKNFKENTTKTDRKDNLYNQWINALAVQWADSVTSTNGTIDKEIWQTKRLQTGLATWTTLRHATILVNERTAAECGEGGFEEILMRAPRGYVEPDPYTFSTIAELFETAINYVSKKTAYKNDISESNDIEKRSLYNGIIERLKEAAKEARAFQAMAEKERKGEVLSNEENEKILYTARISEHLFLVFNSLSNKDYALSNPDPIGKIADIAGNSNTSYLMAAVGNAMEWNYIVPFYGRHQIVKGSIYSFYEFKSQEILNDKEWRDIEPKQEILPWIKTFITNKNADDVPKILY